jgi:WXG100 family type VII secretion target
MRIAVDADVLRAESARLDDLADELAEQIAHARDRVDALVGSTGWSGPASTSFSADMVEWCDAATDGVDALRRMIANLRATARQFTITEEDASTASRIAMESLPAFGFAELMGRAT